METYRCLHCLKPLKDHELVCSASCDHYIHEWCLDATNAHAYHYQHCAIHDKKVLIHLVFKEFDHVRILQIDSIPLIVKKLDEISESL